MISYKDYRKKRWDVLIMCLAIWNGFLIPYDFTFKPYVTQHTWFVILELFIDFIFVADLIAGFFTTFMDNKGEESFDSNQIFYHHTKKTIFYTDLISFFGIRPF